jgi:hypothetical protein
MFPPRKETSTNNTAQIANTSHDRVIEHKESINKYGDDMPDISGWRWGRQSPSRAGGTSTEGDNV